ncbi:MAG: hypothetical protein EBZ89_07265 [Chloroflexi bacterium]|nr:hypothetical protein [Chloroflexota bacterium]
MVGSGDRLDFQPVRLRLDRDVGRTGCTLPKADATHRNDCLGHRVTPGPRAFLSASPSGRHSWSADIVCPPNAIGTAVFHVV